MKAKILTAVSVGAFTLLSALANSSQASACPDDDKKPKVACPDDDKKPKVACPDDDKKPKAQPSSLA